MTPTLLVQGTSGTAEEAIRYGWNYARLLAEGPSQAAMVPSPVMTAMAEGRIARVEELTRIPSDVQDALITILSEKTLPVPELGIEVQAAKGFSVIATANDRDRGVNELSSALRRRFNTVVLPLPASEDEEVDIVARRVAELGRALELPEVPSAVEEIRRVVTVFRELRSGMTADRRTTLKSPTGTMSPAEAISVVTNGIALAAHFGDGVLRPADVAAGITGAVIKDPVTDQRRVGRVPGSRGAGTARLGRLLPRLPRGERVTGALGRQAPGSRAPGDRVAVLGIRHHGPGSARSVLAELDRLQPVMVLIEGPADAGPVLPLAADPGLVPPVALLAYAPDAPRVSAFWPYAVFSPEWQALQWAAGHQVPARFCDLPASVLLASRRRRPRRGRAGDRGRGGPGWARWRGGAGPGRRAGRRGRV